MDATRHTLEERVRPTARSNADSKSELASLRQTLSEALEQQTATAEILRAISGSPTDVQPVFDAIVRRAVRLCGAQMGGVERFDGELLHLGACYNYRPEALEVLGHIYPRPRKGPGLRSSNPHTGRRPDRRYPHGSRVSAGGCARWPLAQRPRGADAPRRRAHRRNRHHTN